MVGFQVDEPKDYLPEAFIHRPHCPPVSKSPWLYVLCPNSELQYHQENHSDAEAESLLLFNELTWFLCPSQRGKKDLKGPTRQGIYWLEQEECLGVHSLRFGALLALGDLSYVDWSSGCCGL